MYTQAIPLLATMWWDTIHWPSYNWGGKGDSNSTCILIMFYSLFLHVFQMNKSRREALDTSMKLEQHEHDKTRLQLESNAALINVSIANQPLMYSEGDFGNWNVCVPFTPPSLSSLPTLPLHPSHHAPESSPSLRYLTLQHAPFPLCNEVKPQASRSNCPCLKLNWTRNWKRFWNVIAVYDTSFVTRRVEMDMLVVWLQIELLIPV